VARPVEAGNPAQREVEEESYGLYAGERLARYTPFSLYRGKWSSWAEQDAAQAARLDAPPPGADPLFRFLLEAPTCVGRLVVNGAPEGVATAAALVNDVRAGEGRRPRPSNMGVCWLLCRCGGASGAAAADAAAAAAAAAAPLSPHEACASAAAVAAGCALGTIKHEAFLALLAAGPNGASLADLVEAMSLRMSWATSKSPANTLSAVLCADDRLFERVERATYALRSAAAAAAARAASAAAEAAAEAAAAPPQPPAQCYAPHLHCLLYTESEVRPGSELLLDYGEGYGKALEMLEAKARSAKRHRPTPPAPPPPPAPARTGPALGCGPALRACLAAAAAALEADAAAPRALARRLGAQLAEATATTREMEAVAAQRAARACGACRGAAGGGAFCGACGARLGGAARA